MNEQHDEQLERDLADLTEWPGGAPALWQLALAATREASPPRESKLHTLLTTPLSPTSLTALVAGVVLVVLAVAFVNNLPQLGGRQAASRAARVGTTENLRGISQASTSEEVARTSIKDRSWTAPVAAQGPRPDMLADASDSDGVQDVFDSSLTLDRWTSDGAGGASSASRQVVRKATIELRTDNVRAAFVKAAHIISEAGSEFVQESSLTGTGPGETGTLTLRVAVDRLSAVLNELRDLGEVVSEQSSGEDVTEQVVDIEARLRNEQRVETELLELLDKRANAPLKDIIALRAHIANVRQSIEQLVARREQLSRLVSLATVLVVIRAGDSPVETSAGIGAHFVEVCGNGWHAGLWTLSALCAFLIQVIVGGLPFWAALIVIVLVLRRMLRKTV